MSSLVFNTWALNFLSLVLTLIVQVQITFRLNSYYSHKSASSTAQLVAHQTAGPGVTSSNPSLATAFMEIDHGITSSVILHFPLIQERHLSAVGKSKSTEYWLILRVQSLPRKVIRLIDCLDVTLMMLMGRKTQNQIKVILHKLSTNLNLY